MAPEDDLLSGHAHAHICMVAYTCMYTDPIHTHTDLT